MRDLFIAFFLLFSTGLHAQIVTVSEEITLRNDIAYEVLGEMKGRLLLFRDKSTDFEVQAFNEQMREIWSKELELDKRLPAVIGLNRKGDAFTLFYRFKRKSQTIVKVHKYDAGANLIDSMTVKDHGYLFFTPDFEMVRSEDRRKVVLYYVEKQSDIHALAFDVETMEVLWDQTFLPEDFDYTRDIMHTIVDNDGNFYMVLEKNNLRYKKETHYYEIHQYMGATADYKQYNIALEGKLTYDVYFSFDNLNNNLTAGGFFAEKNPGRANGYFFLSIPRAQPLDYLLQYGDFDLDFVATLMGKEMDDDKGIIECSIQETVLRQDGGMVIIGERNRQYERRMAGTNRIAFDGYSRFIVDYFYDDLFLISIHPDGSPHWKQVLHKKQYSQDDEGIYSSYFLFKTPKRLRFLFNDEIRQENTVSEYVINGHGEYDRNSVLSTANLRLRLRFRDALQIGAYEVIIPSERRNQLRLVKVEY